MKEAKKKIQKDFGVTAGLLVLSILYTVAIMFIDVRPIGPQGSVVGFATVNQYFHTLFGTNMLLYNITDLLSIPILFVMLGFAIVGLVQLIKRKSLLRVDSSILILGGFYVLVFLVYLFFEFFVVNYRPVLIKGFFRSLLSVLYNNAYDVHYTYGYHAISTIDFKQRIKKHRKYPLWYLCRFYGHWKGFIRCALDYGYCRRDIV